MGPRARFADHHMPDEAPLLDLSALDFRPDWAKDKPATHAHAHPEPERGMREERERPDRGRPPRGAGGFKRGPRPDGRNRQDRRGHGEGRGKFRGPPRREERPQPPPNPFPWLRIAFAPTAPAVETVVHQVRHTGKTFALFDIARILLRNPASYTIELSAAPKPPEGPFHIVSSDGSAWLSREAAARHILRTRLAGFYRDETVEVEPPKGNFTVVAVCGMSGTLLGPPNLHDYERRVRELHREKFGRMDFEQFRGRLRMERDPETVEKWRASASKTVVYHPLEGGDGEKFDSLAAVEKHFLANHAAALVVLSPTASIPGDPKASAVDSALAPLLAWARGEEERFPLRLAQSLSRALSSAGLRFHKSANRTTFVSGARMRHLDLAQVVVSDSIRRILEAIRAKHGIRRPKLLDLLAPLPPAPAVTETPAPATEGAAETPDPAAAIPPAPKSPEEAAREAVVQDLLWLTHEGYVVEYADGRLESVPPPKNPPAAPVSAGPEAPAAEDTQVQQPEA